MSENIFCMQVIQYLLIQKHKICQAIRIISLQKRIENYYSIIVQYRNFWIYQAKKHEHTDPGNHNYQSCLIEQQKELSQLKSTNNRLSFIVSSLNPDWQEDFQTLKAFKDYLECSKSVVEQSSSLYGSYYTEDYKQLKSVALEYSQNIEEFDSNLYKDVKNATINKYKIPENRVYFTSKIVHKRLTTQPLMVEEKRERQISNLKSFEIEKSNDIQYSVLDQLNHIIEKSDSESIISEENDKETNGKKTFIDSSS